MDKITIRTIELQPKIPSWAKEEHMEMCISQKELWRYGDWSVRVTAETRKRNRWR